MVGGVGTAHEVGGRTGNGWGQPEEQRALGQQSRGSGSRPPRQALGIIDYSSQLFAYQNFKQPAPLANKVISKIKVLSSPHLLAAYPLSLWIGLETQARAAPGQPPLPQSWGAFPTTGCDPFPIDQRLG